MTEQEIVAMNRMRAQQQVLGNGLLSPLFGGFAQQSQPLGLGFFSQLGCTPLVGHKVKDRSEYLIQKEEKVPAIRDR